MDERVLLPVGLLIGLVCLYLLLRWAKRAAENAPELPGEVVRAVDVELGVDATLTFEVQPAPTTLWLTLAVGGATVDPRYAIGVRVALRVATNEKVLAEHPGFNLNHARKAFSPFGGCKVNVSGGSSGYYACTAELVKIDAPVGTKVEATLRAVPIEGTEVQTLRLFAASFGKPRAA